MSMAFSAPRLETERLVLRAPTLGDFDALADFYASPRSAFVGGPMTRELAWRALALEAGHWVLQGFGRWVLEEKATAAPVGIVGLWNPDGFPERELGWDLFDGATGKGYATEAATHCLEYGFGGNHARFHCRMRAFDFREVERAGIATGEQRAQCDADETTEKEVQNDRYVPERGVASWLGAVDDFNLAEIDLGQGLQRLQVGQDCRLPLL